MNTSASSRAMRCTFSPAVLARLAARPLLIVAAKDAANISITFSHTLLVLPIAVHQTQRALLVAAVTAHCRRFSIASSARCTCINLLRLLLCYTLIAAPPPFLVAPNFTLHCAPTASNAHIKRVLTAFHTIRLRKRKRYRQQLRRTCSGTAGERGIAVKQTLPPLFPALLFALNKKLPRSLLRKWSGLSIL